MRLSKNLRELAPYLNYASLAREIGIDRRTLKKAFEGEEVREKQIEEIQSFIDNIPSDA